MRRLIVVLAVVSGCGKVQTLTDATSGDGKGADAVSSGDAAPVCGNGIVEAGETCDGNCPVCAAEDFSCFVETGSPSTCDVRCHQPITACTGGDGCCPFAQGGAQCTMTDDKECAGTGWRNVEWGTVSWGTAAPCTVARVYGMVGGDSVLFTLCTPDGVGQVGDSQITSVIDGSTGTNYFKNLAMVNDDTKDPAALPLLAGWSCKSDVSATAMSTAPENDGGFITDAGTFRIDVTVCGAGGTAGSGRLYVWVNGTSTPNQG
jgi:hypothetical protein